MPEIIPNHKVISSLNEYLFSARSFSELMKANERTMAVISHHDARCSYLVMHLNERMRKKSDMSAASRFHTVDFLSSTIVRKGTNRSGFSGTLTDGINTEKSFEEVTIGRQRNGSLHYGSRLLDLLMSEAE
jgi:hypothetical protein